MLAEKIERPFGKTWKGALKRLGITALTFPLVALIGITLLFVAGVVGWAVAHGSRCGSVTTVSKKYVAVPKLPVSGLEPGTFIQSEAFGVECY